MGNMKKQTKEEISILGNIEVPNSIRYLPDEMLDANTSKTMENSIRKEEKEFIEKELKYPYATTAEWIKQARISKNLTQRAFSKISGISSGTIANIEISAHKVGVDIAITLCESLDIDIYLFCSKLEKEYIEQTIFTIKESFKKKLLHYELTKNK